jgi:hypothetical protein
MVVGLPQGLNNLANQNAVYHQADATRLGSSAGLLRTFTYLGAMIASADNSAFFGRTADTSGIHHIGWFAPASLEAVMSDAGPVRIIANLAAGDLHHKPHPRPSNAPPSRAGPHAGRPAADRRGKAAVLTSTLSVLYVI